MAQAGRKRFWVVNTANSRGLGSSFVFDNLTADIDKWEDWDIDIRELVKSVDYALLDASFFADGELPGRDMSKIRHPYVMESMALFDDLSDEETSRVIFIHMNHTNPLLIEGSPEQQEVESRGFRVAQPGMKLPL